MKILKVRFKNINSLRGPYEVDFTSSPLKEAGIFGIVGPTGSGKTTLLDVITLALYNYVPRLGKISKNFIENTGALLSEHTSDCFAEVEYEVKGLQYRSHWEISRNRNGALRDYYMSLSKLPSEELFDLKKSEVPNQNAVITGLDVDRFLKSMMLAQGDFTRFLKAKEEDRSALLEKITGTEIYRRLGKAAYERQKEEREKLLVLQSQVDETKLLSSDALKEHKNQLQNLEKRVSELKKNQVLYRAYFDWKQRIEQCMHRKKTLEQEKEFLDKQRIELDILLNERKKILELAKEELKKQKPLLDEVVKLDLQINMQKRTYNNAEKIFKRTSEINAKLKGYDLKKEKRGLEELQLSYERQQLEAKYEEDRERLQEGEKCYLCGSTNHPYKKHYSVETEVSKKILQEKKALVEQLERYSFQEEKDRECAKILEGERSCLNELQKERKDKFGNQDVSKILDLLEKTLERASQEYEKVYCGHQKNDISRSINAKQYKLNEEMLSKEKPMEEISVAKEVLEALDEEIGILNQKIGSINKELQIHDFWKRKFEDLGGKIQKQTVEFRRWKMLSDVIGDAEGKIFSKFAQSLTLEYLVTLANNKLCELTDRYLIVRGEEQNLSLEILDTYQGESRRSVSTLSGGESFLVSLALALGLADLASNNTRIDSLFIDEGFGSLDQETLDIALATLENLQAKSNKSIGIISHIDSLKERIRTQIQLTKKSGGISELQIV